MEQQDSINSDSDSRIAAPGSPPRGIASAKIQKKATKTTKAAPTKPKRVYKEGIFPCPDCQEVFKFSYLRSLHSHRCPNKVHVPVDCPDCGQQQKNKSALNLHFTNCRAHKANKAAAEEEEVKTLKAKAARVLSARMASVAAPSPANQPQPNGDDEMLKMVENIVAQTLKARTTELKKAAVKKVAPKKKKTKKEDSFVASDDDEDISLQSLVVESAEEEEEDEESSIDLLPIGGSGAAAEVVADARVADFDDDAPVANFDDKPVSALKTAAPVLKKRNLFARIEIPGAEREARSDDFSDDEEEEEKPAPKKKELIFRMKQQPLKRKREETDNGDVERAPEISERDDMEVEKEAEKEAPRNLAHVTRKGGDRKRFREERKDEIPARNPALAANTRHVQSLNAAFGKVPSLLEELKKIEDIQAQATMMEVKAVQDEERLKVHASPAIMQDAQENPSDYEGESVAEAQEQLMSASELHVEYKEIEAELESTKKNRDALLLDARSRMRNFKKALDPLQQDLVEARVFGQVAAENAQDCVDFLKAVRASLNLTAADMVSTTTTTMSAIVNPVAYTCKICCDEEQSRSLVSLDACGHVVCRDCSLKTKAQCPHCRAAFRVTQPLNFA